MTRKEVVAAVEEQQVFGFGSGGGYLFQSTGGRVRVTISAKKELGDGAIGEGGILVGAAFGLGGQAERWAAASLLSPSK